MKFFSKASNFRIQLTAGGMRPDQYTPGLYQPVPGEYAQFQNGQYDTKTYVGILTDEQVIEKLRSHPSYGYPGTHSNANGMGEPNLFWSDVDRPESVALEEELALLRAKVNAYEKQFDPKVIVVEKATKEAKEPAEESGLARLHRLRQEATDKGIKPERHWRVEDYERALAAKE